MKQTFKLPFKALTKNCVRYGRAATDARDPLMFTDAYVQKDALRAHYADGSWPLEITVTVEA